MLRLTKYMLIVTAIIKVSLPVTCHLLDVGQVETALAEPRVTTGSKATNHTESKTQRLAKQSRSRLLDKNRRGVEGMWHELYHRLESLTEHHLRQENLPEFSWFSPLRETKESNIKKIKTLSERLLIELNNPKISSLRDQYFDLKNKIQSDRLAARQAAEDSYLAPDEGDVYFWQSHKGDYKDLKLRKEEAVKEHKREQQKLIVRCHDELIKMGIELSPDQVSQLFKLSSGDLMLTLFSTFAQLNMLGDFVTERMQEAKTDEAYAYLSKRYYAVYVAIISLSLHIHDYTRERLLKEHLNRVDDLRSRLNEVILSTQKLIRSEKKQAVKLKRSARSGSLEARQLIKIELAETDRYIAQLESNLTVQERAKDGAVAYRRHIIKQTEEIKRTAKKISRRLRIAFNTYQTVLIGTNQFDLMREGLRDLSNLQKIQIPAMVPLAGEKITNHLEMITRHFNGEDPISNELGEVRALKR